MLSFTTLAVTANAAVEISDGSVIGLWHFDNDCVDSSGLGFNCTGQNSLTFPVGKLGSNAIEFNGTDQYATISTSFGEINGGNFSVSAWIFNDTFSSWDDVIAKRNAAPDDTELMTGFDAADMTIWNGTASYTCTNSNVGTSGWHHVVWNVTQGAGRRLDCIVDGVFTDSVLLSQDFENPTGASVSIGRAGGISGNYFDGKIDELVVLNAKLSSSTITALYNSGNGNTVCVTAGCAGGGSSTATTTTDLGEVTAPLGVVDLVIDFIALLLGISAIWYYKRR